MATYTGYAQSDYQIINDDDAFLNLSIDTRSKSFAFDGSEAQILTEWVITSGVSATDIDFDEVTRNAVKWDTYSDIFYNRIWVIPPSIDLTGAPSNFSTTVSVWNSYFVQKTMTGVTPTNITGVNFSPTVPHTFKPLEIQNYNFALNSSAPASINGNYQFIFSDAEDPYLLVSGVLSVTMPFFHDWNDVCVERIAYSTDITESKSGKEQRRRLRKYPRRQIEYKTLIADGSDEKRNALQRVLFHNTMLFGRNKTWLAPIVQDATFLTENVNSGATTINVNTQYYDYAVDGYVLLYKSFDYYEVVRIDSLTSSSITLVAPTVKDFLAGTKICPMRQAIFSEETSSGEVIVYQAEDHTLSWDILVQDSADQKKTVYVPAYIYKGFDVWTQTSDFSDSNAMEIYNPQRRLDAGYGLFDIDSRYKVTKERTDIKVLLKSKQEISVFMGFLDYRVGKLKAMWVPTFSNDFQIAQDGNSADTTIKVVSTGYSLFVNQADVRKDIMFVKTDGTRLFRRIEGSIDNGDGTETISVDSSLGFDFTANDFSYICFLRLVRQDSDVTEISYITTDYAQSGLKVVDVFEIP